MSVLLLDSFDDGLFPSKWTLNTGAVTSTVGPRTGTHKLDISNTKNVYRELAGAHATIISGMGINFDTLTPDAPFMQFLADAGATIHISIWQRSTGAIEVRRGSTAGGTILATSAVNTVITGTWYHIEAKVVLHDSTGSVEVRVNNTTVINFSGDTKNGGTEAVISRFRIGDPAQGSVRANVDDVYLLNGAGTSNNDFIGDSRIYNLLPNGNGNYSQFLGSDGNSVDNYLLVDENPPNTSDYVGSGTDGNKDSYAFEDLPATVTAIRAVGQRAYAANSDVGSRAARNLVRIGGADFVSADFSLGASYLLFETLYDVSPATTVAFTPGEFNGAEWGIECRA